MTHFALVPAAGSGARMAGGAPKQYLALGGRPMLWHALRAGGVAPIETVFVVLAKDDEIFATQDWSGIDVRVETLYCGGTTRRDSVFNGLVAAMAAVDADDWMLVHDAARPCLPHADLARLIAACEQDDVGGLLALPVSDTVKRAAGEASGEPRVAGTADRRSLWLAQTPQMFRVGLLAQALRDAKGPVTDEASAVEQLGLAPRLVEGSRENLKVTWRGDIALAEVLLARQAGGT
ncbi:MAG: 2-C-methyl-D-erythritol 4-phosphate cytidylyltransferase [Proteobacteria bacterium]|nr:2-C-methyl-D-erythritol 4-phosphate cytidylyltransferase [Pseudomonadota bacterium]